MMNPMASQSIKNPRKNPLTEGDETLRASPSNNFEDIHSQTLHPGRFSRLLHLQPSPMKRQVEMIFQTHLQGIMFQPLIFRGVIDFSSHGSTSQPFPKIFQKRLGLERNCVTHLVAFCQVRIPADKMAREVQMVQDRFTNVQKVRNVHATNTDSRLMKNDFMYKRTAIQYSILIFVYIVYA